MIKLAELDEECIWGGSVLRCRAEWPFEDTVDFMIVDTLSKERPLGVMVATGRKAGRTLVQLPAEAIVEGTVSISSKWLQSNWGKWVYPECPVEEVFFIGKYPPPHVD